PLSRIFMIKKRKILTGIFISLMLFSILSTFYTQPVLAKSDDEKINIDDSDYAQEQLKSEERIRFRFRERTRITVESNKRTNVSIDCEGKKIGDKDFEILIESDDELNLTMKCREEQKSKGLLNGNTFQVRNRNRYRYQEGFVVDIDSSEDDIEAKLRIEETEENRGGAWAYYDKAEDEWVTVETESKNGYLECETDHFSTWTILVPEIDVSLIIIIGIGIGAGVLIAIAFIFMKKRK
ncbi:MAG: hypothetical protein ACFFAO_07255, partial [Candidatus Hermodarchaeota archaeon]